METERENEPAPTAIAFVVQTTWHFYPIARKQHALPVGQPLEGDPTVVVDKTDVRLGSLGVTVSSGLLPCPRQV